MQKTYNKYFNSDNLKLAYFRVLCWPDRTVKDQVGLRAFGKNIDENCQNFSQKILQGEYQPKRGFKYYMPKASGTTRTKTLLDVEDALIYQAIANVIAESAYELLAENDEFVFGSILSPEVTKGTSILKEIEPNYFFFKFWKQLYQQFKNSVIKSIEVDKVKYKFETDITGFFDCIPHYNLLNKLSERFNVEDEILDLLSNCLNMWSGTKESVTPGVGIPQGPLPSFFLANLLLHDLDDMLVGKGLKYYRYMDDMKIYGYEENDLKRALVEIDMYLKGNGLSINSKKTSILEIDENTEDETVREMRRIDFVSVYEEDETDSLELPLVSKESASLAGQDQNDSLFLPSNLVIITDEEEIEKFYRSQIQEVADELPALFEDHSDSNLTLKEGVDDIDFIRLSVKYSQSIRGLQHLKKIIEIDAALLKYWLFAYHRFFWRANSFGFTLSVYGDSFLVREKLLQFIKTKFDMFEWNRYYALQTLSFNHSFTDKELRQIFFEMLLHETSDLAKISLYRLLFKHSKSKQFLSTLKKQLQKEDSIYLKTSIADFNRYNSGEDMDIVEFVNFVGL